MTPPPECRFGLDFRYWPGACQAPAENASRYWRLRLPKSILLFLAFARAACAYRLGQRATRLPRRDLPYADCLAARWAQEYSRSGRASLIS